LKPTHLLGLAIVFMSPALFPAPAMAALIAITGAGQSNSVLFEINPNTATVIRQLGDTGLSHITGIAAHPTSGVLFAHRNYRSGSPDFTETGDLFTIDLHTGAATHVGSTGNLLTDLTFSPTGELYGWLGIDGASAEGKPTHKLVQVNQQTGGLTLMGDSTLAGTNRAGIAFHPNGTLYLKAGETSAPGNLYTVNTIDGDPNRGAATSPTALTTATANSLAIDANGNAFSVAFIKNNPNEAAKAHLQSIDLATGTVTEVGEIGEYPISALMFANVTAIPEPSSFIVFAMIAVGLVVRRRRNNVALLSESNPRARVRGYCLSSLLPVVAIATKQE